MSLKEYQHLLGETLSLTTADGFIIPVIAVDVRNRYGNIDLQVHALNEEPSKARWVALRRLTL